MQQARLPTNQTCLLQILTYPGMYLHGINIHIHNRGLRFRNNFLKLINRKEWEALPA